jgi:hypothetical protein
LGLSVEPDDPEHANIIGLPFERDLDAEGLYRAGLLAKHARYALRPERRSARDVWDRFANDFSSAPIHMWITHESGEWFWQAKLEDGQRTLIPVADIKNGATIS